MSKGHFGVHTRAICGAISLVLVLISAPLIASQSAGAKTLTTEQKGLKYYQGKTITFIASTSAGSGNDIQFRAQAAAAALFLHATINVEDLSAGNGVQGQDTLAHATPDGLTIGYLSEGTDLYNLMANVAALNFNPSRLVFITGTAPTNFELDAQASSGIKTFAQLRSATASNPVSFLTLNGNSETVRQALLVKAFGLNIKIITGYTNSSAQTTGFLRGDGTVIFEGNTTNAPLVIEGKAVGLAIDFHTKAPVAYSGVDSSVPTIAQLAKEYPPTTKLAKDALALYEALQVSAGYPVVAPSATPPEEVAALKAAFTYALHSPSTISTYDQVGMPIGAITGAQAKINWLNCLKEVQKYEQPLNLSQLVVS